MSVKRETNVLGFEVKKPEKRPRVYVVGGGFDYIRLLYNIGCDGAKGLDDADVVLFTGGADVNPQLYGEVCMAKTNFDRFRDDKESAIFDEALERAIPMVGICRGGQFLNVKNGGAMWQHVNNHTGNHLVRIEVPPFAKGNRRRTIEVTSTHHQMMRPTEDAIILATANEASEKLSAGVEQIGKGGEDDPDIEVVYYDDTHCLCFQPHPEMGGAPADCIDFFEECLDNYIFPHIPNDTAKAILAQADTKPTKKKEKK